MIHINRTDTITMLEDRDNKRNNLMIITNMKECFKGSAQQMSNTSEKSQEDQKSNDTEKSPMKNHKEIQ